MVDYVVGAVGLAVLDGLRAGGRRDDGQAEDVLRDLGCDGPDAPSAADDQDGLASAAAGRDAHGLNHRLPRCRRAGEARRGKAASHWAGADKHASGPYARRGPGVQGTSSTRSLASLQPRTGQENEGHGSRLCVGEVAGLAAHDPLIDEVVLRVGAGALQRQQQQHDGSTGR